jgi:hypothetical protein
MDGFMAASRPAGTLLHAESVIGSSDEQGAAPDLLEVAPKAKVRVSDGEQFVIDGPVGLVAHGASFARSFVFEDVRPPLGFMAARAVIIHPGQGGSSMAIDRALVWGVAFRTAHSALRHRMVTREIKLPPHVDVTSETCVFHGSCRFHRDARLETAGHLAAGGKGVRRLNFPAGFSMQAAGAVTRFAAGIDGVGARRYQARVVRSYKIPIDLLVALFTFFRTDVGCARNLRQYHDRPRYCFTGDDAK